MNMHQKHRLRFGTAAISLVLFACGGGGGGGGGDSAGSAGQAPLSLENIRFAAIDQEVFEGSDPIAPTSITADLKGDIQRLANATVYVIVQDSDELFSQPQLVLNASGLNNQLVIGGRPLNARTGDFRGSLTINVCTDAQCTSPFRGSPFQVPYRVKVVPGLRLASTGAIALDSTFGGPQATWTSQVQLPGGAADFNAGLGLGKNGNEPSYAMSMSRDATSISLQGRAAPVGEHQATLAISAYGVTSTGRRVVLTISPDVVHRVAATRGITMSFSPAQAMLSAGSGSGWKTSEYVSALSEDGQLYYPGRVEYLPPGTSGNLAAGNVNWLRITPIFVSTSGAERYTTKYLLEVTPECLVSLPKCLPVGAYQAQVFPRTNAGVESRQPVSITLSMEP
jgi:hypothetical protein